MVRLRAHFAGILLIGLVALSSQSPVSAQEPQKAVLPPTDDTYVNLTSLQDSNFGSDTTLQVSLSVAILGRGKENFTLSRVSFLKFNLSVPPDSIIRSASLNIFLLDGLVGSSIVALRMKNNTWTERTLTGNTAPDIPHVFEDAKDRATDKIEVSKLQDWYSFNLTKPARSIRTGILAVMLAGGDDTPTEETGEGVIFSFASKENPSEERRPFLQVTFSVGKGSEREVYLTLDSSHFGGSATINGTEHKFPKELEIVLDLRPGFYKIGVSQNISISRSIRAVFEGWNDGSGENPRTILLNESLTLAVKYEEFYFVKVTTEYGTVNGTGWYKRGSEVSVKVFGEERTQPPLVKAEGIFGAVGVNYVFDHWSGYSSNDELRLNVLSPITVTAVWKQDLSRLYQNLEVALAAVLVVFVILVGVSKVMPRHFRRQNPSRP